MGRKEGSLPLLRSRGTLRGLKETRGRAFQVEGTAYAKAQRSERTTVFLQE